MVLLSLISTIFTTIYSYNFQVLVDNLYTNDFNILIIIIVFLIILFQKNIVNYLRFNLLNYLNQKLDLDEFIKCISDNIVDLFVVDSLIISNITGSIERESLDYISEIISLFNIKNDKFYNL